VSVFAQVTVRQVLIDRVHEFDISCRISATAWSWCMKSSPLASGITTSYQAPPLRWYREPYHK